MKEICAPKKITKNSKWLHNNAAIFNNVIRKDPTNKLFAPNLYSSENNL